LARLGLKTLVMSVDPAHSLADAFAMKAGLFDPTTADPYPVRDNLDVQEVNIQIELKRHWRGRGRTVRAWRDVGDPGVELSRPSRGPRGRLRARTSESGPRPARLPSCVRRKTRFETTIG
jgi:hypothetical protein